MDQFDPAVDKPYRHVSRDYATKYMAQIPTEDNRRESDQISRINRRNRADFEDRIEKSP